MLFTDLGWSILGKTVPSVSLRPQAILETEGTVFPIRTDQGQAILETEGTVFPNTDRPRLVNSK